MIGTEKDNNGLQIHNYQALKRVPAFDFETQLSVNTNSRLYAKQLFSSKFLRFAWLILLRTFWRTSMSCIVSRQKKMSCIVLYFYVMFYYCTKLFYTWLYNIHHITLNCKGIILYYRVKMCQYTEEFVTYWIIQ